MTWEHRKWGVEERFQNPMEIELGTFCFSERFLQELDDGIAAGPDGNLEAFAVIFQVQLHHPLHLQVLSRQLQRQCSLHLPNLRLRQIRSKISIYLDVAFPNITIRALVLPLLHPAAPALIPLLLLERQIGRCQQME
jgi:hypothetical protein